MSGLLDPVLAIDTRWALAFLLFVLDAWSIWLMTRANPDTKELVLWSAIVILVPVFGCLFWYALGPKPRA